MLLIVLLISTIVLVSSHFDEFDERIDSIPFHQRFRILRDDYTDSSEFLPHNITDTKRRLTTEYWNRIKDDVTHEKLSSIIHKASGYKDAQPFPHMSAMDVFPSDVMEAVNTEINDNPARTRIDGCVVGGTCYNSNTDDKAKNAFHSEKQYGPATLAVFTFMQSALFIKFLEKLTGIDGILPDGAYKGAGIHQTLSGGYLNVHADFNLDRDRNLHRRVNVFLYVNPDWKDEYGGHLELWTKDLKNCTARISPDLGRLAVFSTTDFSYHGHQNALRCPKDRSRRSLAMYYYSKTRPSDECINNNCFGYHATLFQKTHCSSCSDAMCYTNLSAETSIVP